MAVCDVHFRKPSRFERMRPALICLGSLAGVGGARRRARASGSWGCARSRATRRPYSLIAAPGRARRRLRAEPRRARPAAVLRARRRRSACFGTSDVTARAMPALFGVLLALLPLLFARHIGRAGAIVAALLLAVSPTMIYYSRFAGPDIYLAFFTLATAMVIWRYLAAPHRVVPVPDGGHAGLHAVTSEMALVVIAIFAAYLAYRIGGDFIEQTYEPDLGRRAQPSRTTSGSAWRATRTSREIRLAYKTAIDRRGDGVEPRGARERVPGADDGEPARGVRPQAGAARAAGARTSRRDAHGRRRARSIWPRRGPVGASSGRSPARMRRRVH